MAELGEISGDRFCGITFGKGCGDWENLNNWTITVPPGKPPVQAPSLPEVTGKKYSDSKLNS